MTRPRLRAVVLAAGHGTRLRPLTAARPKPLLPILGRPLIGWTLERLAETGVEAAAINLHHLPRAIPAALGDRCGAMPLVYSREETLMGTLGALHPLRDFLAPADLVLLVNGDSLCRWPFDAMIERHRETGPLATLLLSATADPDAFGGGIAVDERGGVLGFPPERLEAAVAATTAPDAQAGADGATSDGSVGAPGERTCGSARDQPRPAADRLPRSPHGGNVAARRVFAGAHVFAPALLRDLAPGFSDSIRDLYRPRLREGARIETVTTAAPWHDLGTPERYLDAVVDWAERARGVEGAGRLEPGSVHHGWIAPTAVLDRASSVSRSVIEDGAVVEQGATLRRVLALERARLGRASRLENVVIAQGVVLPPESVLENALVTPGEWGTTEGSRVEGSLVVTPFGARRR